MLGLEWDRGSLFSMLERTVPKVIMSEKLDEILLIVAFYQFHSHTLAIAHQYLLIINEFIPYIFLFGELICHH